MTDYLEEIKTKVASFNGAIPTDFLEDIKYLIRRLEEREAKVRALGNEVSRLRKGSQHKR